MIHMTTVKIERVVKETPDIYTLYFPAVSERAPRPVRYGVAPRRRRGTDEPLNHR